MPMKFSIIKAFYWLASLIALFFILKWMKFVMAPLTFAFLLSFVLFPICKWLESKKLGRVGSIVVTFLGIIIIIGGISTLFSTQIIAIGSQFKNFQQKLTTLFNQVITYAAQNIPGIPSLQAQEAMDRIKSWLVENDILSNTLTSVLDTLGAMALVIIFTFLILLYRNSFVKVALSFAPDHKKDSFLEMLKNVQRVGQKYIYGLGMIILILSTANSIGLMIIGIDYAIFFGVLAGFLTIIPYIGTNTGAVLPALYALMNYDSYWYAIAVIIMYTIIQFIEGNFLTPTIVGREVSINPFVSIISLIVGGSIWGIAGVIIALPFVAILKVICDYYEELKPISNFLGDEMFSKKKTDDTSNGLIQWVKRIPYRLKKAFN